MIADNFHIDTATWTSDADALRAVRHAVFVIEQQISEEDEWDDRDASSLHVLARDPDGNPIGTGRLTSDRMIGRLAVLREWRGQHVGIAMMHRLLDLARERGYSEIAMHSQSHALEFYSQFGFQREGEEFIECAIPHLNMRLRLAPTEPRVPAAKKPAPEARELVCNNLDEARAATLDLLKAARYEIAVFSRALDSLLYDQADALVEMKRIAISGARARIRIIVQDAAAVIANGHRIVPLAQRLSSVIEIRTASDVDDAQRNDSFLLNDAGGYLLRPVGERFEGTGNTHARGRHAQLLEAFETVWARALPAVELRALDI